MPAYDVTHFNPPAPLARVTLRNPSTGATAADVELLVDSGADVTLLPRQVVEGLGISLASGRGYEIAGFDGSKSFVPAVNLEMLFLNRLFKGQYLVIEEERGILGRDVLNHIALLLDGPRLRWDEHRS
jgi:predicted aspartyl protease